MVATKRVLITGVNGFLGQNLRLRLRECNDIEVLTFTHESPLSTLPQLVALSDYVFHLAGVNRPNDAQEFVVGNVDLTRALADALCDERDKKGRQVPVIFASSTQAASNSPYGLSKHAAEEVLLDRVHRCDLLVKIFRLPNVFGKWCKPNYNSAVATFCHNIARELPIQVHDPDAPLTLVYIEDVLESFVGTMNLDRDLFSDVVFDTVTPEYNTTVGIVAELINGFSIGREALRVDAVGKGLVRGLYATYISYLPARKFSYPIVSHADARGTFVEMLKTPDAGQCSFFTAHPGVTRGGHYHHTKTEKFLVIQGEARFRFRHMITGEYHEIVVRGEEPQVVDTIPGWSHDISNIGQIELIVMLWANEVFDPRRPDTVPHAL